MMGALAPVALCVALLATSARAACTCPDTPFTCTVDSLFSISGEENCVPSGGVLDASIVMPAATELTAVDFAGLTRVTGDILFPFSASVTTLAFPELEAVDGTLDISSQAALTAVTLTALATVAGDVTFRGNALLVDISLPSFTSASDTTDALMTVEQNDALLTLSLPAMIDIRRSIIVGGPNANTANNALRTIDMSSLITTEGYIRLSGIPVLDDLDLTALQKVGDHFYIGSTGIGSFNDIPALSLPNLETVGTYFYLQYLTEMAVLELPLLESTGEYFIVSAASALTSLSLPSFVSASGLIAGRSVSVDGPWTVLESIALPMLTEVLGSVYVRANEGTTPLTLELGAYDGGNMCVRAANLQLGSATNCNFPADRSETKEAVSKTEV